MPVCVFRFTVQLISKPFRRNLVELKKNYKVPTKRLNNESSYKTDNFDLNLQISPQRPILKTTKWPSLCKDGHRINNFFFLFQR